MMGFWKRIFRPEHGKADLDAEIESHLALAAADKCDRGATPEAARSEAEREFGNQALVKDTVRRVWGWVWVESLQQDIKCALRQLRRSAGFSIAVIATLAFGLGAATAMFTVVDQVLLRPLSYPHPERLVTLDEASVHGKAALNRGVAYLDLQAWQEQNKTFQQIAYYIGGTRANFLEGTGGLSLQVGLSSVSPNFFPTVGVRPSLGHGFEEDVDPFTDGKNVNSILLSDAARQQMYGTDTTVVGKSLLLNGKAYTVVGVMPRGFAFGVEPDSPQVWTTVHLQEDDKGLKDRPRSYGAIGRLKDGVSLAAAQADLKTLQAQIAKTYEDPDIRESRSNVIVGRYADSLVDADLKRALIALLAAAGVLWLIACVNVTNLFLVRATARQREIAVRGALGASRIRIMQQLIAEGLLLSGVASILGSLLALAAINVFEKQIPSHLPLQISASANGTILLALIGLTLLSTIFSSVWPSFLAAHMPIEPALKQGGQQSGTNRRQHRIRSSLVIAEIAMSLTLLAGCGLLLRTIYALRHVPLGFRTDHILVASLTIPAYRFDHRNMTTELYQPLLERVQHLPGVSAATLMTEVPLGQTFRMVLSLVGKGFGSQRSDDNPITSNFRAVSPEAQQVFGFGMLSGRYFNRQDTAGSQPVAVVNRAFARLYAPDLQNPNSVLGMNLLNMRKDQPIQVVGVLDDARQSSIMESQPEVEICIPQITPDSNTYHNVESMAMDVALRTERPLASITPELRTLLRQASPEFANATFTTMDQVVADSYGNQTLAAHLLELFGATALLLCISGLYGLLAYVVAQRTREIGLRIALGAQRWQALWLVLRQAGALVIAGVVIGTVLAVATGKFVRGFLYGVAEHDAWTLTTVALLLLASGGLAAYFPARKAAMVNPIEALRTE
jgi:predicted permease